MYNRIPAGNVLLSSAILFAGAIPSKVLLVMKFLGCQSIHRNTFFLHQSRFLWPTVQNVWRQEQREILDAVREADYPLVVGGDGRADTPGHSAKYGCYTLMDLETKKILIIELVQVSIALLQ
jgi:solute carrier family 8 (sodium/calcium exchanger)